MGLLKSIDNVPGIDYLEHRETDYWGKYKYRARMKLVGANLLWFFNQDIAVGDLNWKYEKDDARKKEIVANLPTINALIKWISNLKKQKLITSRVEGSTLAIFSNDVVMLQELRSIHSSVDITEVVLAEYAGTKYFVNKPKHNYRVYFKTKRIDLKKREELDNFLLKNSNLHPSKSLKEWLESTALTKGNWTWRWLSAAHSIDYDDESMLSYLALMHGELLGKRFKLEKRPEDEN